MHAGRKGPRGRSWSGRASLPLVETGPNQGGILKGSLTDAGTIAWYDCVELDSIVDIVAVQQHEKGGLFTCALP